MLTVFVFDERTSERVDDWRAALGRITDDRLLWFALRDPTEGEVAELREALELDRENAQMLLQQPTRPSLAEARERLHVTLYAAGIEGTGPLLVPVQCVLGPGWAVTAHSEEVEVLEEFRERAEGGGRVGALDAPSFAAAIFEWVVVSYFRAFEAIERTLEDLDTKIMSGSPKDVSGELDGLVKIRRSIGMLGRMLYPHREIAFALAHPEFDSLSTEHSAKLFADIERRLTQALDAAGAMKSSTFGTFDLLDARIGQRTNDVMKLLTLVTVILLPSTVLAGVMGMNFKVGLFDTAWLFWVVLAVMGGIAVVVLSLARRRSWI
jgi:magnesium transporter